MKLSTLLEYQACFEILKSLDYSGHVLTAEEYKRCLCASGLFDFELGLIVNKQEVEVTA